MSLILIVIFDWKYKVIFNVWCLSDFDFNGWRKIVKMWVELNGRVIFGVRGKGNV